MMIISGGLNNNEDEIKELKVSSKTCFEEMRKINRETGSQFAGLKFELLK